MKTVYYVAILLLLIVCVLSPAKAENNWKVKDSLTTGLEPVGLMDLNNLVNVFCLGIDKNFNGSQDDGDQPGSWWRVVGIDSEPPAYRLGAEKLKDFEFGFIGFPFRAGLQKQFKKLYISQFGRLRSFDAATGKLMEDTVLNVSASAVSANDRYIFLSIREGDSAGYVLKYDPIMKKVVDTIPADANVQQTLPLGSTSLAVLSEGVSSGTSTVRIYMLSESGSSLLRVFNEGVGANHLTANNNILAITYNGSHEVRIIDLNETLDTIHVIKLPTSGFNGPRESVISPDGSVIYTTAYNGNIYISSISKGIVTDSIPGTGKAESILIKDNQLFVSYSFSDENYSPGNKVLVFALPTSVNEEADNFNISFYPNPASDCIEISMSMDEPIYGSIPVEIVSSDGIKTAYLEISSSGEKNIKYKIGLKSLNLSQGVYFIRIHSGVYVKSLPLVVVK